MHSDFFRKKASASTGSIYVISFLLFLLFAYAVTIISLLFLAFLLYKIPLSDSAVNIGIILIYIISTFSAAFLCGRKMKHKKYLWGFLLGISYFAILFIISLLSGQSPDSFGNNIITSFFICVASSTLGGMLA